MSTENANGDWKPNAVSGNVYDYSQYNWRKRPSNTKRTVTTVYEYDEKGNVKKSTTTEVTETSEWYDYNYPYVTYNTNNVGYTIQ